MTLKIYQMMIAIWNVEMRKSVIAGSYGQYKCFLRENNLTPNDTFYLADPNQLRGLRDIEVIRYGTFYMRSDINDIEERLQLIEKGDKNGKSN